MCIVIYSVYIIVCAYLYILGKKVTPSPILNINRVYYIRLAPCTPP